MRTRNGSPRRRGPGLSDVTRASDTETPSAEEESAGHRDGDTGAGSDVEGQGELDVENNDDGVDVENDDNASDDVSVTVEAPSTWHADWDTWQSYFTLYWKHGTFTHNHAVSPAAFVTYPTSRGLKDPIGSARVDGMLAVGAKHSRIYDYIWEQDQNVIQVDADNLVRGHASAISNVDDSEATTREFAAFAAADSENVSTVAETEVGEAGVISLATDHMRCIYGRFSEVFMIYGSHKTNRYNYQLLTFMRMNEFGEGAVMHQSLIEANGDWHMDRAIAHFQRSHPTRIHLLRVIVVGKDLHEICVLEEPFSEARVIICHFHVIKYLKEKRSKPEYGKISTEDASYIDAAIRNAAGLP